MQAGAPGSLGKLVFPRCRRRLRLDAAERGARGSRQIAFGLCDTRLERNGTNVVWCDIKNLIKFPQRFREATKTHYTKAHVG